MHSIFGVYFAEQKCTLSALDREGYNMEKDGTCRTTAITLAPTTTASTSSTSQDKSTTPSPTTDQTFELGEKCLYVCALGYHYDDAKAEIQCVANPDKASKFGLWEIPGVGKIPDVGCQRA